MRRDEVLLKFCCTPDASGARLHQLPTLWWAVHARPQVWREATAALGQRFASNAGSAACITFAALAYEAPLAAGPDTDPLQELLVREQEPMRIAPEQPAVLRVGGRACVVGVVGMGMRRRDAPRRQ
jgi:hypothetical protein